MIWHQLCLKRHTGRPFLPRLLEPEIIIHQQIDHNQLDFIASEEASWTSMSAIAKRHILQVAGSPLQASLDHRIRGRLSDLLKSKRVEFERIGEYGLVHGNRLGWYPNRGAGGNYEAIGETVVFMDDTFKGAYTKAE